MRKKIIKKEKEIMAIAITGEKYSVLELWNKLNELKFNSKKTDRYMRKLKLFLGEKY